MSEDAGNKEDKFDFTAEGEALGYISLDQARIVAMGTARDVPGDYGGSFRDASMAFSVTAAEETEDYYEITLSIRPQGEFSGTPGQEQFFIEKEGTVAHRQVLSSQVPAQVSNPSNRYRVGCRSSRCDSCHHRVAARRGARF